MSKSCFKLNAEILIETDSELSAEDKQALQDEIAQKLSDIILRNLVHPHLNSQGTLANGTRYTVVSTNDKHQSKVLITR